MIARSSVKLYHEAYGYLLPTSKTDHLFEGANIITQSRPSHERVEPLTAFLCYLHSRDQRFPYLPSLWLTSTGTVPTRRWFLTRLHTVFPNTAKVGGHSLRSGGATHFALQSWPDDRIQALGRRWKCSSNRVAVDADSRGLEVTLVERDGLLQVCD